MVSPQSQMVTPQSRMVTAQCRMVTPQSRSRFHPLRLDPTERKGLCVTSYVKCEQILTLSKSRLDGARLSLTHTSAVSA
ncbi:MAG TPA: hypothetical protein DD490_12370 [Acidobacteria bacterium]|nr:hypothetical protein [Acidobacteriota bacterium]